MARLAIRMPKMSMTMTEGEVSEWMVSPGDEIAEGDVVCEVMTDKIDMEVESTVSGTLIEIVVHSGMAAVGEPIGWIEGEDTGGSFGDLLSEPDPEPEVVATTDAPAQATVEAVVPDAHVEPEPTPRGPVAAVPRARGLARERGIDLALVTGTGPDGLVRVEDVEASSGVQPPAPAPAATLVPAAAPAPAPAAAAVDRPAQGPAKGRSAKIRAAVARKMTESATVPQFTVWRDVLLDDANEHRQVSWTTVLLQAYAAALREVPELLDRWETATSSAQPSGPPSVALAVATADGLLVPVFTEPDLRDPRDLDAEVKAVVTAAHSGRLDPSYLGLANGSLSNLGGLGVDRFQALVTPPQASVLALGSIARRPVAVPGGVGLALSLTAGLTVDHRVGDGAHAANLLAAFVARLGSTTSS